MASRAPHPTLEGGRVPVTISTFDVYSRKTVLHSSGPLAATVAASCAIPLFFQPVRLAGRPHVDGGVGDLLALKGVAPLERVLSVDLHTLGLGDARAAHVKHLGAGAAGVLHNCTRLQLRGLPFVGPSSMGRGPLAFAAGHAAMVAALGRVGIWGGDRVVRVPVKSEAELAAAAACVAKAHGGPGAARAPQPTAQ